MLRIRALAIDDHILEKIEFRHNVTFVEVEEACLSVERHVRRGREGLYTGGSLQNKVFSKTGAGRYVLVVLADQGRGAWKVVTARQMTVQEQQLYRRVRGA